MLGWFINFTLQYFDFFLIIVLIVLVTLVMSRFIKGKRTLIMVMGLLVLAAFITVHQSKYTTFQELYDKTLKEDSVIDAIKIRVYDPSSDFSGSKTIKKQDSIRRIMDDFSKMKLKKDADNTREFYQYHLEIIVTNQVEEDRYLTKIIHLKLDQNFLNNYKIISDTNHLESMQTLLDEG
jgi:hypothetical protein